MRAVALLLVCAGLVRVGAFSSLVESEQIESRSGVNTDGTYVEVAQFAYCANRDRGKILGPGVESVQACADKARADKMCGSGFSFTPGGGHCDCSPVGEPCVAKGWPWSPRYTVYGFKQVDALQYALSTYLKVAEGAYCFNRVFPGKSRYAESAAACAAAVAADPACGNGFSFYGGENSDRNLKYCDCPPPGAQCVAEPFNTGAAAPNIYTVYNFPVCGAGTALDAATMKCSAACGGTSIDVSNYYVDPSTNVITPLTLCGAGQYQSAAPTLTTDRGCTAQPTCANYQKVDNPGDSMTRRTCKNKCAAWQYYSAGTCKALAVCAAAAAEVTPATATSNRVCSSATMLCDTAAKCKGRAFSSGTISCSHPGNVRDGGCYGAKFTGDVTVKCSGAYACETAEFSQRSEWYNEALRQLVNSALPFAKVTCSFKDACSGAYFRGNSKVTCSVAGACDYPQVEHGAQITCDVPDACKFYSDSALHNGAFRNWGEYTACCRGPGCPTQAWNSYANSPTTQPAMCCGGGLATAASGCPM
jgi:hypothetical protein